MILPKYLSFFLCLIIYSIHSTDGQMNSPGALWKSATIPYVIDSALARHRATILAAMDEISKSTCVKFVPKTNQRRFLNIKSALNCETVVGSVEGGTPFSLSERCVCKGIIMHGLFHAAGVARPGDFGPNHVDSFPCTRLTYDINNPQLCDKSVLNQSEINSIKGIYKC